jgi:ribosomal-protein-alanine N-acetyltransferase
VTTLVAPRLALREWRDADLEPYAALNADPEVMRYFPNTLDRDESDASAARVREHFHRHGFGPWAVEIPGVADFAGFVGLMIPSFEAHFTPCVEIGWRLARAYWGQGYATEAARAVLDYAWGTLALDQLLALTIPANRPSRAVMERIGMTRSPTDDFDHPAVPADHPMARHVLYRIDRPG